MERILRLSSYFFAHCGWDNYFSYSFVYGNLPDDERYKSWKEKETR
nr:hypothetical protein [uncultured Pedobacter sp.]